MIFGYPLPSSQVVLSSLVCALFFFGIAENSYCEAPANSDVGIELTYQGLFRLPFHTDAYKGDVHIEHDGSNGLFIGGQDDYVGKVQIAAPIKPNSSNLESTNIANNLVVPLKVTRGRIDSQYEPGMPPVLTGLALKNNRLYVNHGRYYDVANNPHSGFCSIDLDLAQDTFEGFYSFDTTYAKPMSGPVFPIPNTWALYSRFQFLLGDYWNSAGGGPNLRGATVSGGSSVTSTSILYYGLDNAVPDFLNKDRHWDNFGVTVDSVNFVGVIARKGVAPGWYGPADGGPGGEVDECDIYKGYHADSYRALLYFFNEQALTHAADSEDKNVTPIIRDISNHMLSDCARMIGSTAHENTVYIAERGVDDTRSIYTLLPVIHVFSVSVTGKRPKAPTNLAVVK